MVREIAGISSMATRSVLADLGRAYERRTGLRVSIESVGGVDAALRVRAGERTDLVVLASKAMEQLEAEGHVASGSGRAFARSGIAMAVRSGAQRPSARDEEAVKQAILGARRVCYSTGPSGDSLRQVLERWGIADVLGERMVQAPSGVPVGALLARGEADLGFQQLSELLDVPGIDIVGPLPPEIQAVTVFVAGVASTSRQADQAGELVGYLASPEADALKIQHGMDPM